MTIPRLSWDEISALYAVLAGAVWLAGWCHGRKYRRTPPGAVRPTNGGKR